VAERLQDAGATQDDINCAVYCSLLWSSKPSAHKATGGSAHEVSDAPAPIDAPPNWKAKPPVPGDRRPQKDNTSAKERKKH